MCNTYIETAYDPHRESASWNMTYLLGSKFTKSARLVKSEHGLEWLAQFHLPYLVGKTTQICTVGVTGNLVIHQNTIFNDIYGHEIINKRLLMKSISKKQANFWWIKWWGWKKLDTCRLEMLKYWLKENGKDNINKLKGWERKREGNEREKKIGCKL